MAIKAAHKFIGLETDRALRSRAQGSYDYALNIHVSNASVKNIKGNTLVSFSLPSGTNKCIGSYESIEDNAVYYFIWNSNTKNGIYKYNVVANSISKVFPVEEDQDDILNFQQYGLITGVGFINGVLYWTDGINPQRSINVTDALTYPTPYLEAFIDLIKIPPTKALECDSFWVNEADTVVSYEDNKDEPNYMADRSFQFIYRYIRKDNEASVWSVRSKLIPTGYSNERKNKILITIDNNEVNDAERYSSVISFIEIAFRDGNSLTNGDAQPFKLIKRIPFPTTSGAIEFDFRNDEAYPVIDTSETGKFFDSIPLTSQSLEIARSRIFLGANREGFSVPDDDFEVTGFTKAVIASPTENKMYFLSGSRYSVGIAFYDRADRKSGARQLFSFITDERHGAFKPNKYTFTLEGQPPIWATHYQILRTVSRNKLFSLQVVVDVVSQTSETVIFKVNSNNSENVKYNFTEGDKCSIISKNIQGDALLEPQDNLQVVSQTGDEIKVKWVKGTNAALASGCLVEFYSPRYSSELEEYFEIGEVYEIEDPHTVDRAFGAGGSKTITIGDGNIDSSGDIHYRRITKPVGVLESAFAYLTFKINDLEDKNIVDGGSSVTYKVNVNGATYEVLEVLPPLADNDQEVVANNLYTQLSANTTINVIKVDATTITIRAKQPGNVTFDVSVNFGVDGNINTNGFDPIQVTGQRSPLEAGSNYLITRIEAMSANDDFYENWQKNIGRANVIFLEQEKEIYKSTSIRWSGVFVQDTNINLLSSFDFLNQKTLPVEFGALQKLQLANNNQAEGSVMLSIHKNEIASLYLEQATVSQAAGGQLTANTTDVIGSVNPLGKRVGSINPESVKQKDGRVYGFDVLNGIVWRYGQNGLDFISSMGFMDEEGKTYGMREFFYLKSQELVGQSNLEIYGGIDPFLNQYIITMPGSDSGKRTLAWDEDSNKWTTFYSFIPENFQRINTKFISFKSGALWLHHSNSTYNNFYGVQYTSKIKVVCNQEDNVVKILQQIEEEATHLWNCPDISTPEGQSSELLGLRNELEAYVPPQDFYKSETTYFGNVMRDRNTPNEDYPLLNGDMIRSNVFTVLMENSETEFTELFYVNLYYIHSFKNNRR
jgi:hypothetical protein